MKQNVIRLILDSSLSPVIPKVVEGVKNDYFVLLLEFGVFYVSDVYRFGAI